MPVHIVQQGESFAKIARKYGYESWKVVYEHSGNQALRDKRPNPNILHPGDRIFIPDKKRRTYTAATGSAHTFKVPAANRMMFRMRLLDDAQEPLKDVPYALYVDGALLQEGRTDGDGRVEAPVDPGARRGELVFMGRRLLLAFDTLDPISRITGVQARLVHLGFNPGPIDGKLGPRTRSAVLAFQASQGLEKTGLLDEATRKRLLALHDHDDALPDPEDDFQLEPGAADSPDPDDAPPRVNLSVNDDELLAGAPREPWRQDTDGYEVA